MIGCSRPANPCVANRGFPRLTRGAGVGAGRDRWPGREFREASLGAFGSDLDCPLFHSDHDSVFSARPALVSALNLAAMRGVRVDIHFALRIKSALCPMCFPGDVVASAAAWMPAVANPASIRSLQTHAGGRLLGTYSDRANWDSRSLRLNFEFNLECYDVELAQRLDQWFEANGRPRVL